MRLSGSCLLIGAIWVGWDADADADADAEANIWISEGADIGISEKEQTTAGSFHSACANGSRDRD
jgi:hypothetical protein